MNFGVPIFGVCRQGLEDFSLVVWNILKTLES